MKQQYQQLLQRIDALSMRERIFLVLSVFVCVLALADFVWFTPAQTAHKALLQRFTSQSAELNRLRGELAVSAVPNDPGKVAREELRIGNARLDALNAEISSLAPQDQKAPALEQVLQRLLRRHEGLTLLSLETLKAEAGAASAAPAVSAGSASASGLTKHGLVLRVAGPYAELVRYVQALESALPGLRWGPMELKVDKLGNALTLQVYAVGVQP
jgi:MSHA biogenesis protein MshJ